MHDWTRVTPNEYHTFHGRWTYALCDALNAGLLPAGFYAMADFSLRTVIPDVLTLQRPGDAPAIPAGVATAPPRTRFVAAENLKSRLRTRRVSVCTPTPRRHTVIAIVEIVSPGKKARRSELRDFVGKVTGALDAGVHVLVVDPFPPGPFDPEGIHGAIWKAATGRPFELPDDKPLTLAAYEARTGAKVSAFVEPVAVGDALRDMPLFLGPDVYVNAPLEATYQTAWAAFPAELRAVVAPDQPPG
ncbi:MAG: DUF4058 domain-containing protein [Gemmataceae bacterium]